MARNSLSASSASPRSPVGIAVSGACGRMGREILRAAARDAASFHVALAFDKSDNPAIGTPINIDGQEIGILSSPAELKTESTDVLIDFSVPAATMALAAVCGRRGIGMVVGTTGFSEENFADLKNIAKDVPILVAQNMSIGVNVMFKIARDAAMRLHAGRLGGGYDMEVYEAHHKHKKDAPSGTALRLGRELAEATGADFFADAVLSRPEWSEEGRGEHDIGVAVTRGGDIAGEHRAIFAGAGEQLEIVHRSTTRANYASGALRAARFIATAPAGFYDGMDKVLYSK